MMTFKSTLEFINVFIEMLPRLNSDEQYKSAESLALLISTDGDVDAIRAHKIQDVLICYLTVDQYQKLYNRLERIA